MFHMGTLPRRNPDERRRQRAAQRRRQEQSRIPPPPVPSVISAKTWETFFTYRGWNLIPIEKFTHKGLYYSMCFEYTSFEYRYTHFMNFCTWIGKPTKLQMQSPHVVQVQSEAKEKFFLNQRLRYQFKRLVSAYLRKKMPLKNEVDPITFESPIQKVFLYDHAHRCTFQFEAKQLLRDFSTRLLTHDDLFPTPLPLRNPLTNAKLHIGQLLSVYFQIKSMGHMHWTFECLQDAQFKMALFCRDNMRKLRLSALRNLMNSPDGIPFLFDFIEVQHDIVNKPFDVRTYDWALRTTTCQSIDRIRSWKTMCYTFYEIEITEEDIVERQRKISKLTPIILNLCSPCEEIQRVRRSHALPKP
jgi:hypothetical protein